MKYDPNPTNESGDTSNIEGGYGPFVGIEEEESGDKCIYFGFGSGITFGGGETADKDTDTD